MICKKRSIFVNGLITLAAGLLCFQLFPSSVNGGQAPALSILLGCLGFSFVLTGQFIRISARGYKSLQNHKGISLVTDGPYGLTRNPMYLGSFLIGFGMFLILFPWWTVPIYCVLFLGWYAVQIQGEQERLVQKLGDPYQEYCRKVPVFFPRLADLLKRNPFHALPFQACWVKREYPTIFVWLIVALADECVLALSPPQVFFCLGK